MADTRYAPTEPTETNYLSSEGANLVFAQTTTGICHTFPHSAWRPVNQKSGPIETGPPVAAMVNH